MTETPSSAANEPALRGSPSQALNGATIGFFIGFGAVSLFGPTAHSFVKVMSLSPEQVGFLVAIPMLTGSLLRIPFGAWVDTTGGKLPFLILLILSVLGIGGLYYMLLTLYPDHLDQSHYPWLLLFGALGGCGIATFSVGIGQVSYWFPKQQQGWALAAYAGFGNTSPGLVALAMPLMITFIGLWGAYLVSLAIVVVGIGLYLRLGHNAPYFQLSHSGIPRAERCARAERAGQELFPQASALHTLMEAAAEWRTWLLVVLYFTTFGGFLALTAWFPTYWQSFFQTSHWVAVILTATFSLLSSLIRVPGGRWADRFGGELVAVISLTILLAGALLMTFSGGFLMSVIGELLVGAGMGVNNAAVFRMVPNYVPHAVGGAAGLVGGLGALGGFAVPPLLGYFVGMMGAGGYARGFVVYIGLAVLSLILTGILRLALRRPGLPEMLPVREAGR
ncbi:nitrate/nitrite transporter [Acidocella sp. KAb 2-4]|uniref:MFS transporter n=1 Tax=Acidocella sp. KAb 2-4 TaxID=2885158 RepID=UPI001D094F49|nr:MFS transporter [Acidocella sp. KAb 2-4]MCB5944383.1 MFS transporter [Acidocella sp. KAb 2-4]